MAYEEQTTGILFALLMESDYLTQEQLEVLTGSSRATISEVLSRLQNITDEFPILQTRKPNDRKKYYYCPSTFEQYVRNRFLSIVEATKASVDFIPPLLARLDKLITETPPILHVKQILSYMLKALHYYRVVGNSASEILDDFFKDPDVIPDFNPLLERARKSMPKSDEFPEVENDSLEVIKKEFISKMLELSSDLVGGQEELIKLFFVLYLEHEPVTQDDLIELTNYSRGKVSQALNMVLELKVVQMVKKSQDRKNYYEMAMGLDGYVSGKITRTAKYYEQIGMMLEKRFLPGLSKILAEIDEEKAEKERLTSFFQENIRVFQIFHKLASLIHSNVQEELQKN
jgi:DNA-binding transcriptional regulator GbsR (MarR family)